MRAQQTMQVGQGTDRQPHADAASPKFHVVPPGSRHWLGEATSAPRNHMALSNAGPLLLVDDEACARSRVRHCLAANGFGVTGVASAREALEAAAETRFTHAVVELRLGRDSGPGLIAELRDLQAAMRIVVVTGFDSFASVILALRAGACDYLPKPVDPGELVAALLGRAPPLPPVPDMPLGLVRICWEHTQRVFEQCDRNVTRTAQQLGMHRRTLQRILIKRSPPARGMARA